MKPSDVVLLTPPLTGTMERSECEVAAALLVRCCQVNGDTWATFSPQEVGEAIQADLDAGVEPFASWDRNPFIFPDFFDLAQRGYAIFSEDMTIFGFTEKGLTALKRWARQAQKN